MSSQSTYLLSLSLSLSILLQPISAGSQETVFRARWWDVQSRCIVYITLREPPQLSRGEELSFVFGSKNSLLLSLTILFFQYKSCLYHIKHGTNFDSTRHWLDIASQLTNSSTSSHLHLYIS